MFSTLVIIAIILFTPKLRSKVKAVDITIPAISTLAYSLLLLAAFFTYQHILVNVESKYSDGSMVLFGGLTIFTIAFIQEVAITATTGYVAIVGILSDILPNNRIFKKYKNVLIAASLILTALTIPYGGVASVVALVGELAGALLLKKTENKKRFRIILYFSFFAIDLARNILITTLSFLSMSGSLI